MRLEIDGVAIGPPGPLGQSPSDDCSGPVIIKPVTRRYDIHRGVAGCVVDDKAARLLAPRKITRHPDIDRAARGSLKVPDADAFGDVEDILKEVVVDDVGLDGL